MKNLIVTAITALTLLALPASAQTLNMLLPTLSFPEGDVTSSTKGCVPAEGVQGCAVQE